MTFADLQTAAERDVWLAELQAMAGSPRAEFWAAHAIERHRACHSGPMEAAKVRRRSTKIAKGTAISDAELMALAERCKAESVIAVPDLPPGNNGRQRQDQRTRISAFATRAMQTMVGTTLAAQAMGITEQGARNRSWSLLRDHPEIAERADAFACGITKERQQQKGKAA